MHLVSIIAVAGLATALPQVKPPPVIRTIPVIPSIYPTPLPGSMPSGSLAHIAVGVKALMANLSESDLTTGAALQTGFSPKLKAAKPLKGQLKAQNETEPTAADLFICKAILPGKLLVQGECCESLSDDGTGSNCVVATPFLANMISGELLSGCPSSSKTTSQTTTGACCYFSDDSDEVPGQISLACTPTPLMHLGLEKEESVPMEQEPIGV